MKCSLSEFDISGPKQIENKGNSQTAHQVSPKHKFQPNQTKLYSVSFQSDFNISYTEQIENQIKMQPKKKIGHFLHFSHLNRMNLLGLESSGLNSNSKGKPFYTSESNTFIHQVDISNSVKPNRTKKIKLDLIIIIHVSTV